MEFFYKGIEEFFEWKKGSMEEKRVWMRESRKRIEDVEFYAYLEVLVKGKEINSRSGD